MKIQFVQIKVKNSLPRVWNFSVKSKKHNFTIFRCFFNFCFFLIFQFIQKIPAGFFTVDFIKKVFKIFPTIIAQHSDSLLELLNSLHKSNVFEINEFSSICFIELFSNELSDKKEIIGSLVQFLCEKVPQLPFGPRSFFIEFRMFSVIT